MLAHRLSGAMFSENYGDLAQLTGYNFNGIPSDFRYAITSARPENPGETEALINNPDGLSMIRDFQSRWTQVSALSSAVDELRADPAAVTLVQFEQGLSSQLLDSLLRARNFYPWGNVFGRTVANQLGLTAALSQIDAALSKYLDQIPGMIKRTQTIIQDRETVRAEAIKAEADRHAQEDAARAKEAQAQATVAEAQRAQAQSQAFTAQTTELQSKLDYEKLVRKSNQTMILGMPLSIVAPVGLAAALGLFLITRRKSGGALSGYRRSNPHRRAKRRVRKN